MNALRPVRRPRRVPAPAAGPAIAPEPRRPNRRRRPRPSPGPATQPRRALQLRRAARRPGAGGALRRGPWLPIEDDAHAGGPFIGGLSVDPHRHRRRAAQACCRCSCRRSKQSADEYVDLVAGARGDRCGEGLPVHVEGYPPPSDPRLNVIKVTPDPGVLEINIHPTADWDDPGRGRPRRSTRRRGSTGSTPRKFMIDGRPTGSGGGAHVVVGAARRPEDSPFLRRPDLLGLADPLLAEPPVALIPVLGPLHRPDQPGAADRRGAPRRRSTSWRSRSTRFPIRWAAAPMCRLGWSTGCSGTCWST